MSTVVDPEVIYLSNACGEDTGHGVARKRDLDKIAFEEGPGVVLPYLAKVDGKTCVVGNLEVAFQDDEWWGEDSVDFDPEDVVKAYCEAACRYIEPRLSGGAILLPIGDDMPGRFVVGVAIPLAGLRDSAETSRALADAFGAFVDLPDLAAVPGIPPAV